jgi:hydrogenase expression/formation protein HypE
LRAAVAKLAWSARGAAVAEAARGRGASMDDRGAGKVKAGYVRALDLKHGRVDMTHGGGGRAMTQLIEQLFAAAFDNPWLAAGNDGARFALPPGRVVMATDSHVVSPLFFPGGDIGSLAVHGTLNDVAMMGAAPAFLAASFILEEGLALASLKRIVDSMAKAASQAGVPIVTGDTKVVEQGKADGVFITTTGIGVLADGVELSGDRARPGDRVLVSGCIGDHGMAIMSLRESLSFATEIRSDSAPLHTLVAAMIDAVGENKPGLRVLRDPTRGGLATTVNEIATQSRVGIMLDEAAIPVRPQVEAACEFLGLDPLYVANEGKLVAVVAEPEAEGVLAAMRAHPLGADSALIGEVIDDPNHFVQMATRFGGRRIVDWLTGDQLPRIC